MEENNHWKYIIVSERKETHNPVLFSDLHKKTRKGLTMQSCTKNTNFANFTLFLGLIHFFLFGKCRSWMHNYMLLFPKSKSPKPVSTSWKKQTTATKIKLTMILVKARSSMPFQCPMLYQIVIFQIGICLFRAQCCCHHHLCSWWQRFVSSIGNIEKAMWVFNCRGRSGWFGQSEIILQTDNNFSTQDIWQFSN